MLTYKRGIEKYNFFLSNGTQCQEEEKVYHVYQGQLKIGFISNDKDLETWFFYKNTDSDYLCGGSTLKETKVNLLSCLTPDHRHTEKVHNYFNN